MKLDKELATHIVALQGNPHWGAILTALGDEGEKVMKNMINHDLSNRKLRELKGRMAMLTDLMDTVSKAQLTLEQLENQQ